MNSGPMDFDFDLSAFKFDLKTVKKLWSQKVMF